MIERKEQSKLFSIKLYPLHYLPGNVCNCPIDRFFIENYWVIGYRLFWFQIRVWEMSLSLYRLVFLEWQTFYQILFLICSSYRAHRIVYKSTVCFLFCKNELQKYNVKFYIFILKCYNIHLLDEFKWLYFLKKSIWNRNSYCFIDNSICSILRAAQKQHLVKSLLFGKIGLLEN